MPEKHRLVASARQRDRLLGVDAPVGKDVVQFGAMVREDLAD